jgi:hypothetical protein
VDRDNGLKQTYLIEIAKEQKRRIKYILIKGGKIDRLIQLHTGVHENE